MCAVAPTDVTLDTIYDKLGYYYQDATYKGHLLYQMVRQNLFIMRRGASRGWKFWNEFRDIATIIRKTLLCSRV